MVSLVQSWPILVAISFRYPVKFAVCLAPRLPREIQVLPSRIDSICCELNQILASKKLGKGHAAEIFGKLSFSAGNCLVVLGACIWHLSSCVSTGEMVVHTSHEIERAIAFWLHVLPRGPFRAVPPHSGTPFVITMSDGEGTGSVAAAIWSPLAPGGVHQPRWFQLDLPPAALRGQRLKNSSLSVTSTKSRRSSLQSVFVRGPTSFAVPFGYTSLTTMLLWPALSPGAQKAALQALLWTTLGRKSLYGLSRKNFSTALVND